MDTSSTARVKSGLAWPTLGLLSALCSPLLSPASAAERTWNVTSGVWQTGGNWIGGAPSSTDTAYFSGTSVGSSNTISILGSTSQTVAGLTFAGSGTTAITGTTGAARTLVIGSGGLTIQSGAGPVVFGTSALASTVSGTTVALQVAGSQTWRNDSAFTFAHYGTLNTPSSGGTNSIITLDGSGNFTFSGAISGAAGRTIGIVKSGSGALTLAQANTFTGGFTLSSGTLVLASNNTLGAANNVVTIAAGGVIDTGAAAISNTVVTPYTWNGNFSFLGSNSWNMGTGAVTLGAGTVAVNVANLTASGSLTVGGAIGDGGAGRRLEKTGSGMLVLNGTNSGFSGGTQLTSGTILVGGTASLGTSGSLTFAGGVLRLSTMGAATDYSGRIKGSTAAIAIDTGTVTSVSYSGAIDASNVAGLMKIGNGVLVLAGANAYTGTTTLGGGAIVADGGSALGDAAGTLTFASGTLSLTGNSAADYSARIRGSTGAIVIDTGTVATVTFASSMDGSNVAGFTKTGTGALVLVGTNAYFGPTTIGQGTLQIGNGGAAGSLGTGTAAVTNSGALVFSRSDSFGTLSGPVSGAGSVTLSAGAITLSGSNTLTGGFTLGSSGTVVLSSTNALGGPTSPLVINGGAIDATAGLATTASYAQTWNNGFAFLGTGTLNLGSGAVTLASVPLVTVNVAANSLTVGGAVGDGGGARRLEKAGPGTLILNGTNSGFTGGTLLTGGTIQLGGTAALGTSGSLTFAGGVVRLTVAGAATDYSSRIRGSTGAIAIDTGTVATVTYAGDLDASNVGGLAKTGTGILVLTGSSSYAGITTISAGSLQIGAAGVLGLLPSGSVANAGTLVFNRTDAYGGPVANAISGTGGVTLSGGTLTLAGNNTYGGTTAVNGGVLVLGGTNAIRNSTLNVAAATNVSFASAAGSGGFTVAGLTGSGTVTLQNEAAAAVALTVGGGNASTTFSGRFVGPGSLAKVGSGTLTLSGSSPSFSGGVTLSAGRLGLGTAGAIGSGTFTIAGDGSVSFDNTAGTGATTWSNPQAWNADFSFGGAGVGAVFTGGVTLGGSRTVTVSGVGGQSLQITGTVGDGGAGYGITKEGLGDMTLGAANTFSGTTTIKAGRLTLGNASAIGTGPLVLSGGTLANSAVLALPNNAQFWNGDFTFSVASSFDLGTGPVTLGGNRTATFNLGSATVGGSIGDGGAGYQLRRAGTTDLTLGGSNSYSGGTVLAGGVTIAANAYALGTTGSIDFEGGTLQYTGTAPLIDISSRIRTSGSTVIVNLGGATVTYASSIDQTNTAGLSALGSGTLVLSASNSYGGGTTLASTSNLTLLLNNDFALSGGAVSGTGAAGALSIDNTSGAARSFANPVSLAGSAASAFNVLGTNPLTFAGTTTILGNATFTVSGTAPLTLARLDSDTGARAFTKSGSGTLVLTSVGQTFGSGSGNFTVSGGTLITGLAKNLGSGTVALSGAGTLQVTTDFTGTNAIANPVSLSSGARFAGPGSVDLAGPVSWTSSTLAANLDAGETLTLSGPVTVANTTLTYSGSTNLLVSGPISGGGASTALTFSPTNASVTLSGSNSFGVVGSSNTSITSGTLNINSPWALAGSKLTANAAAVVDNTSGGPIVLANPSNMPVAVSVTFGGSSPLDFGANTLSSSQDISVNVLTGTVAIGRVNLTGGVNPSRNFYKEGNGTLVITTGSSWSLGIGINSGTVRLGPEGRISDAGATWSPSVRAGMLDFNGVSQAFNTVTLGGGTASLPGTRAVVATGTGTLTLNSGNITFGAGGDSGLVSGRLMLLTDTPLISVADTTTSTPDLTITADIMSSATTNNLTKSGAGMLALSGSNTYSGTTTVSAGGLRLDSAFALPGGFGATGGSSNLSMSTNTLLGLGTSGTFARGLGSNGDQVKFGANGGFAAFGGDRFVNLGGGGVTTWGAASFVTGTFTLSAAEATGTLNYLNALDLGSTAGTKILSVPHGSADVDAVMSGVISGSSNFTLGKVGQGTLSLTAASTYSGTTSIRDGVVQIASLAAAGSNSPLGTGSLIELGAAATSGTLRYTGSGHASNRGFSLTGNGALDAIGSGSIQFSGGVTGTGAVARAFTLTGTSTAPNALAGIIADGSGTTSLVKNGVGSWTLSGNNSFTGPASVVQGTLVVGHASALGAGPRPLVGGTDAGLGGTASLLLAAGISLGRDLEITAAGGGGTQTVILGGANTTGTSTFGTAIVRVARDVTLQAAGGGVVRFQSNWTGASGSGSLTDRSFTFGSAGNAGTVLVSSSIATSGGMTVAAGILRLADQIVRPGTGLPFTIASAGELAGTGTVAAVLAGAGSVGPGNSPGILLADGVDPAGGLDFDLEFTDLEPLYSSPTASRNDILRLTGTAPFTADLTAANSVDVYLPSAVAVGQTYRGGFFTDRTAALFPNFRSTVSGGAFAFYVSDPSGTVSYKGNPYSLLPNTLNVIVSTTTVASANFSGGTVTNGQITTFVVVPEPGTLGLAAIGTAAAALRGLWRRRRRHGRHRGH